MPSRIHLRFQSCLTLLVCIAIPSVPSLGDSDAVTRPPISVSAGEENVPAPDALARFDFGARSVLDTSPITHTFLLRSQANKPLTIDRLQPSCRCTSATVEGVRDESAPFTLAPGQQVRVRVIISPGDAVPGAFEKEVYVFAGGDSTPTATLEMTGTLLPPVTFSPDVLDFGRGSAAQAAVLRVTVSLDSRLLASGKAPQLRCDNPNIVITPLRALKRAPTPGVTLQAYQLSLSPQAPRGPLKALLFIVPSASAVPSFGPESWGTATVTGEVLTADRTAIRHN